MTNHSHEIAVIDEQLLIESIESFIQLRGLFGFRRASDPLLQTLQPDARLADPGRDVADAGQQYSFEVGTSIAGGAQQVFAEAVA
ncbi:MAG: hypothetical protein J2P31_08495, partial [Blastocatellia bacterium]|nr:hypothetical protein [Blastocatellia bacterium]